MKRFFLIAFLMLYSVVGYSQQNNSFRPHVETSATVDTLVVPDKIYLTIRLDEKDSKGRVSIETLEGKMQKALKASRVDIKKQVSLFNFGSDFSKYFLRKKDVSKTKTYKLLVYSAQEVADVLLNLEKVKISNVSFYKAEYSKKDELMLLMKQKAVVKAQVQAKNLVKPLNQKLGSAIFISDANSFASINYDNNEMKLRRFAAQGAARIEAEFRKIKITASVRVKFHLY
ncbi:MAG: SIMPL domain-containing protein [Flavobacteriaceae bacterium]